MRALDDTFRAFRTRTVLVQCMVCIQMNSTVYEYIPIYSAKVPKHVDGLHETVEGPAVARVLWVS